MYMIMSIFLKAFAHQFLSAFLSKCNFIQLKASKLTEGQLENKARLEQLIKLKIFSKEDLQLEDYQSGIFNIY